MSEPKITTAGARTQHTPGPWNVFAGTIIQDSRERTIVALDESHQCRLQFDEIRANAHLIAAAPDLLAKAKALHGLLDKHSGQPPVDKLVKLMREMDEAIQIAEGRSE